MIEMLFGNCADWYWIRVLTVIIETVTCFSRFVLKKESTRDTAFLARYTFGLRIHHGYTGVLLVILCNCLSSTDVGVWFLRIGWSCIFSDIIHHCILRLVTGSFQFDLVYEKSSGGTRPS